jgi:hypothetical protein
VTPAALQRQVALAGAALLALLLVVVLDRPAREETPAAAPPASGIRWETAVVGVFGKSRLGKTTACGITLTPETRGVAHPVLPCGVRLIVSSEGREIHTEVIERGPGASGTQFDLTPALADDLGIEGRKKVRWRFAG